MNDAVNLTFQAETCETRSDLASLANQASGMLAHLEIAVARASVLVLAGDSDAALKSTNSANVRSALEKRPDGDGVPAVLEWEVRQSALHAVDLARATRYALNRLHLVIAQTEMVERVK